MSESKCCSCCCSCGSTQLTLQANIAYMTAEQSFSVQGSLDASMSKTKISNYKVVLREKLKRWAGKAREDTRDIVLYDARKTLSEG